MFPMMPAARFFRLLLDDDTELNCSDNTYLIPLKSLSQPSWVDQKVDTKEVLRKLTAISISAYCNQCAPQHGTIAVDNLVFQK